MRCEAPRGNVCEVPSLCLAATCRDQATFSRLGCEWKVTEVCWPEGDHVERGTEEGNWCKCIPLTNERLSHIILALFPTKWICPFFPFPCILNAFK